VKLFNYFKRKRCNDELTSLKYFCEKKKHAVNQLDKDMSDEIIEYAKSLIKKDEFDEFKRFSRKIRSRLRQHEFYEGDDYFKPGIYYGMKIKDFVKAFGEGEWVFDTLENVKTMFKFKDNETGIVHYQNSDLTGQNFVYPLIVDGKELHKTLMVDAYSPVTKTIKVHPKSKNKEVFIISYDVYGYYFGEYNIDSMLDGMDINFHPNKEGDRVDFVFEDNSLSNVKIISNETGLAKAILEY